MKRKVVNMRISVTVPADMSAADARREVRYLIKDGSGWARPEDVTIRSVRPAGREGALS